MENIFGKNNFLMAFILVIIAYLIVSAIVMGLWNSALKNAVAEGSIKKISYGTALGITLLFGIIFGQGPVILNYTTK